MICDSQEFFDIVCLQLQITKKQNSSVLQFCFSLPNRTKINFQWKNKYLCSLQCTTWLAVKLCYARDVTTSNTWVFELLLYTIFLRTVFIILYRKQILVHYKRSWRHQIDMRHQVNLDRITEHHWHSYRLEQPKENIWRINIHHQKEQNETTFFRTLPSSVQVQDVT
jgi:hypothetical protein